MLTRFLAPFKVFRYAEGNDAFPEHNRNLSRPLADLHKALRSMFLIFCAVLFTFRIVGSVDHILFLWPVTGISVALALAEWKFGWMRRSALLLGTSAGVALGGIASGQPCWLALALAMLTYLDVLLVCAILSPQVQCFDDLKRQATIARLMAATACVPTLSALLGAYPLSLFVHAPYLHVLATSAMANALGIALLTPAILFLRSGEYRNLGKLKPHLRTVFFSAILFALVVWLVFSQSKAPLLFLIFPPMIAVLLVLGLEGAVLSSAILAGLGWLATEHRSGPIMLMHGATHEAHILVLQLFVLVALATALPVGALLDERTRAERSSREAQAIYRLLLENSQETVVVSSLDGFSRYVSPAITHLSGWTPEEYMALDRRETYHPDDRAAVLKFLDAVSHGIRTKVIRYRLLQKGGGWKWVEATVRSFGGEPIAGYIGTLRDISAMKEAEEIWSSERDLLTGEKQRMESLALTDPLTGLLNRRGFDGQMREMQKSGISKFCLLMIDVDFFKRYNDSYGHPAGDQCLVQIAQILKSQVVRQADFIARYGGEEFAVVLPNTDLIGAMKVAANIRTSLRVAAIEHQGSPFGVVTLSVGATWSPLYPLLDVQSVLASADRALYRSKGEGRDRAIADNAEEHSNESPDKAAVIG
jgi:diguanylate cyclase (GGDEF)-like protein/PAS domain S-box-containing protein